MYERCLYVICRAYILCLTNLRILSLGTGRGAVQKLARSPENLFYGSDCNISGFCGIVFGLLSSGSRHGVILSQLGYSPVFHLQLLRDQDDIFPRPIFLAAVTEKSPFLTFLFPAFLLPGVGLYAHFPPFRGMMTIYHGSYLNDLTASSPEAL